VKIFDQHDLDEYQIDENDIPWYVLGDTGTGRWLLDSMPLRMIFKEVYDPLFKSRGTKVLDVGGGYNELVNKLGSHHDYTLVDLMVHDKPSTGMRVDLIQDDWLNIVPEYYDTIISNNLFPYVDQRLELFLDKFLPWCRKMRLSLTYYNFPKWYKTQRTDAEEVMHLLQWNGNDLCRVLTPYTDCDGLLEYNPPSLFSNGRQVCFIELDGGAL
jgi:hypothetical protein